MDEERRRLEEEALQDSFRPQQVPSFCWTEDELRDWQAGYIDEWELRRRHGE